MNAHTQTSASAAIAAAKVIKGKAAPKDKPVPKGGLVELITKPIPEVKKADDLPPVPATVHAAALAHIETGRAVAKATGAEFKALQALLKTALPYQSDITVHLVIVADINTAYKAADSVPMGLRVVTMLNNTRSLAYGKAATRNAEAIPAQGLTAIVEKIEKAANVGELQNALALRPKVEKGAQTTPKAQGKANEGADDEGEGQTEKTPLSRPQALLLVIQLLERTLALDILKPGTDFELIGAIGQTIKLAKAA